MIILCTIPTRKAQPGDVAETIVDEALNSVPTKYHQDLITNDNMAEVMRVNASITGIKVRVRRWVEVHQDELWVTDKGTVKILTTAAVGEAPIVGMDVTTGGLIKFYTSGQAHWPCNGHFTLKYPEEMSIDEERPEALDG